MITRFIYAGDDRRAKGLIYDAQLLLNKLKTEVTLGSLSQLSRSFPLESGDFIKVSSFFGQDTIYIESPFEEVVVIAEKEIEVPFIVRFSFRGSRQERYYLFWDAAKDELFKLTDKVTGEEIEQPVLSDDLRANVIGDAIGTYGSFLDMSNSTFQPGADEMFVRGQERFKRIRFNTGRKNEKQEWDGGVVTFITVGDDVQLVYEYYGDLNVGDPGLQDPETGELYYHVGPDFGAGEVDYFLSHGKVIYSLPNSPDDTIPFWGTKLVNYTAPDDSAISGNMDFIWKTPMPSGNDIVLLNESFVGNSVPGGAEDQLKEVPNFWIDNVSSAITNEGRAVIFEQIVTEKYYENNQTLFIDSTKNTKTEPTYDTFGRIWAQSNVKKIPETEETGEARYDYKLEDFVELNSEEIFRLIKAHSQFVSPDRLFGSLFIA